MADLLWRLSNLSLPGASRPRLAGVSLEVPAVPTAVLGESGAGKTSLLNLLVGFEKPGGGELTATIPASRHSLPLFWVPVGGGLWPHLRLREQLAVVQSQSAPADQTPRLLEEFELTHRADAYPAELSQGERSRAAVARALAADAAVLVMDEPLAHVDRGRGDQFWQVLEQRVRTAGSTLIFATHDPRLVLCYAQRVLCLHQGRLLFAGAVADLYYRPPTVELCRCLGEGNFLLPAEAGLWLGQEATEPRCLRPEQVAIEPAAEGALTVRTQQFGGAIAATELEHDDGARRLFYHRPAGGDLRPGMRVALRLLGLLLLCLLLISCGRGGEDNGEPTLAMLEVRHWPSPPAGPKIPAPRAVTIGRDDQLVMLDNGGRVVVFDAQGKLLKQWPMPERAIGNPQGVCVLKDGRIAVADTHYGRLVFFDQEGKVLSMLGQEGRGPGQFVWPINIVQDDQENFYVSEYGSNDRVQKFTREGKYLLTIGSFGTGAGQFQRPSGMVWRAGKLYVADAVNNRILVFRDDGQYLEVLGQGPDGSAAPSLQFPYGLAFSPRGEFWVSEFGGGRITMLSLQGQLLGRYGSPGQALDQFNMPWGIAVDSQCRIRVGDTGNRRIAALTPADPPR